MSGKLSRFFDQENRREASELIEFHSIQIPSQVIKTRCRSLMSYAERYPGRVIKNALQFCIVVPTDLD